MSRENHEKFMEKLREINEEIAELTEKRQQLIKNRELVDHLYIESIAIYDYKINTSDPTYEYAIKGPVFEGYDHTSNNIINICKVAGINRKTLKTYWVKELNGHVYTMSDREIIQFKNKETAQKALDWLIARIMINKLKNS